MMVQSETAQGLRKEWCILADYNNLYKLVCKRYKCRYRDHSNIHSVCSIITNLKTCNLQGKEGRRWQGKVGIKKKRMCCNIYQGAWEMLKTVDQKYNDGSVQLWYRLSAYTWRLAGANIPVSQFKPVKPGGQIHSKSSGVFVQVAPLRQGLEEHPSLISQSLPTNPAGHSQV